MLRATHLACPSVLAHRTRFDCGRLCRALGKTRRAPCRASGNGCLSPCSVGRKSPTSKSICPPLTFHPSRYAHSGPGLLVCAPSRWPSAPLPGLLRLKVLLKVPVERSSSPGNRGLASRLQVRAKLEGRSRWRLPSGLWHASIFPENRPGQSEVRANTRASGVAGGGWKGVLRGAAAPSSTRLPLPGGRHVLKTGKLIAKHAGSSATRQKTHGPQSTPGASLPDFPQSGSGGLPFKRLKGREPGRSDSPGVREGGHPARPPPSSTHPPLTPSSPHTPHWTWADGLPAYTPRSRDPSGSLRSWRAFPQ